MIKRIAVIATIALFFLMIASAKAATLTGNVAFTIKHTNGTDINYKLYNVTSTSGTVTLYNGGIDTLDNSGGGTWMREDVFQLAAATAEDAQYCIKISGDWINVTNSTGALKASLYDPLFWDYVSQNGSDIRITNQDGQLYFWIEDFNSATQQATIWVNLSTGSTELDVAYGNPSALPSAYDNGTKTFPFFDDFNSLSKWTILNGGGTGTATIATYDGKSMLELIPGGVTNRVAVTAPFNTSEGIIEVRAVTNATVSDGFLVGFSDGTIVSASSDGPNNGYLLGFTRSYNTYNQLIKMSAGTGTVLTEVAGSASSLTYYNVALEWKDGTLTGYIDGKKVLSASDTTFTSLSHVHISTAVNVWFFDWIFVANTTDPASFSTPYQIVPEANVTVGTFTTTTNATTVAIPSTAFSSVTKVSITSSENLHFNATLKFDYAYSSTSKIIDTGTVIEKNFTINTTGLTVPITLNVTFPLRTESYKLFVNVSPSTTVSNTTNTSIITSYILQNNTSYNINEKVGYLIAKFIGKDELTSNTLSTLTVNYTSSTGWRSTSGASVSIYGTDLPLHQTVIEFSSISYSNRHYILDATKLNQSVTLYLLADSSSTMITYTVVSGTSTLPNAKVEIYKYIGDKYVLIDSQYTDASGVVAVPLHAFDTYKVVASKPGYNTVTATITVTQATYTIKLGGVNLAIPASHRAVVIFKPSQSTLQPGNNTISIDIIPQGTTITTATMTVYVNNTPVASTSKSDITAPTTLSVPVTLNQSSSVSVKVSYTQDGQTVTTQKNYTVPVATGLWATLLLLNNQLNFPGGKTIGLLIAAFITLAVVASLAATTNTNARGLGLIGMIIFTIIALPLGAISIGILVVVWVAVIAAWILWRYI